MKTIAIIQCRMASTRLPGKAMKILLNRPVLDWVICRSLRAKRIDKLYLATSTKSEDDIIETSGNRLGIPVVRGDQEDVLSRYLAVLRHHQHLQAVVRITADNPLTDPGLADQGIDYFLQNRLDYCYTAKAPYGTGVDIFRPELLKEVATLSMAQRHREHINTYFLDNHPRYRIGSVQLSPELERPDIRVTLDTQDDYNRLVHLFSRLEDPAGCCLSEIIKTNDTFCSQVGHGTAAGTISQY